MASCAQLPKLDLPNWLPPTAGDYLQHTVLGTSIRSVARARRCHPSTILRQIRRLEARRDDPLIDSALACFEKTPVGHAKEMHKEFSDMATEVMEAPDLTIATRPDWQIDQEGLNVLRRLCERGAILAVAKDMESAVVVREDTDGQSIRTAVVERPVAQSMALRNWIATNDLDARIVKYAITTEGKRAVRELTAKEENEARSVRDQDEISTGHSSGGPASRYVVVENPIMSLSRRKDKTGKPFISKEQLSAGKHLRQDFEISGLSEDDLRGSMASLAKPGRNLPKAVAAAQDRLRLALEELGPGLSEVAIECCCLLRGLEVTEKKMGWSSRSGKIVLRIALTRLLMHYQRTEGKFAPLIG